MYDKDQIRYQPYEHEGTVEAYIWLAKNEVNIMSLTPFNGELLAICEFSYSNKGKKGWRKVVVRGDDIWDLEDTAAMVVTDLRKELSKDN